MNAPKPPTIHNHINIPDSINVQLPERKQKGLGENGRFLIATLFIILGWLAAGFQNSRTTTQNKLLELRTSYAIDTYMNLHKALRMQMRGVRSTELEDALANVELFGTADQIRMAHDIMANIDKTEQADIESLLKSLRNDLRQQVDISLDTSSIKILLLDTAHTARPGYYWPCPVSGSMAFTGITPKDVPPSEANANTYLITFRCEMCGQQHKADIKAAKLITGSSLQY